MQRRHLPEVLGGDTSSRVLAYSRSTDEVDEVDELRRLSILGRRGPELYLKMLRDWGGRSAVRVAVVRGGGQCDVRAVRRAGSGGVAVSAAGGR